MASFERPHQGASRNPDDRLKGEILASLADWRQGYGTERLELGWTVLQALLKHIERTEGIAALIEFDERAAAIMADEAASLREVYEEDARARAH